MVGWIGDGGNGGESRDEFFLNHPHQSIPAAAALFSQGGAFSQREPLQSNYSHLIPAWEERAALPSAISNTHFALESTAKIEEPSDQGAIVLRQTFGWRAEKNKGNRKELSLQDAALVIQMGFRAYLIRRSQVLRALREPTIAKTKLRVARES
ncbi:PREDICTED: BAG family molecular chaperone regulator 7-like [Ipomoea nil]|uniref:BAG family molecular chaperone regulator 7-like n=1 Tax=Ipomoea nil TaxID=35883 RepID=UPI000901FF9B|nr:PREDICTED: BAG family molecular chaperone regulator 7-like [Ipomoea nil]